MKTQNVINRDQVVVGAILKNNEGKEYKVLGLEKLANSNYKVIIRFLKSGNERKAYMDSIKRGCVIDTPQEKLKGHHSSEEILPKQQLEDKPEIIETKETKKDDYKSGYDDPDFKTFHYNMHKFEYDNIAKIIARNGEQAFIGMMRNFFRRRDIGMEFLEEVRFDKLKAFNLYASIQDDRINFTGEDNYECTSR
jgi:hypothetical protein